MKIRKIYKTISLFSLTLLLRLILAPAVLAHCPLCTAGAGAGLVLSRWLGIDDSITGIWMAAFLGASGLWFANSLKKKYLPYQSHVIYWLVIGSTIWSFYAFELVNEHAGLIMGIPKLIFGLATGAIVFYLVDLLNSFIRKKKGRVLFSYQPIVFSLTAMLVLSVADFIFINYYI